MFLKLVPDDTHVPFTKMRFVAMAFSALLIVGSIVALYTKGLNFGIDFLGGVTIEVADSEPIDEGAVRDVVSGLGLGNVSVQSIRDFAGSEPAVVVFVQKQEVPETEEAQDIADANEVAQQDAAVQVQDALRGLLGDDMVIRKVDVVGPTVSGELIEKGVMAVILAVAMMLIYIWLRFEWQFSVGAIVALVHDVIITLGMFSITQLKFELAIIAALLTIVGYSMNDTVVVYDRVRENLRKYKQKPLAELLDISINDTLSRTVMTSVTTLLALVSLAVFGGEVLRGFTLAMIWGVVIGTYSSVFVASPFLLLTNVKRDWSKQPVTQTP
ncbi:MAG: protein translocase subunit SecF [Hyphococcus sp.]|nr:MAG: protein translocase subunit SecF [Marinicaulis sp.]